MLKQPISMDKKPTAKQNQSRVPGSSLFKWGVLALACAVLLKSDQPSTNR